MLARGRGRTAEVSIHRRQPPTAGNSHICTICHWKFSSYQALGGHKGRHKTKAPTAKDHQTSATIHHPASPSRTTPLPRKPASVNSMSHIASRTYQCSICLTTFASGQALGGHKRRHFEGGNGSASAEETENIGPQGYHGFDLNLPASPLALS
ncbi:hypothetical protein SAY87_026881 [Trapa incisa]|uniref:C2H2-type domain-containing protein n=1 Tax=Trapa incisa TaxID=236973 RepID=A0AAN7GYE5_9MYRT|nr:hypothetical protein SAY87_026881 [Trapa incisa]